MRVRIFRSALTNVKYAAGFPLTVGQYLALPAARQQDLHALVRE